MSTHRLRKIKNARIVSAVLFCANIFLGTSIAYAEPKHTSQSRVEAAVDNITSLNRPGHDGYAAVWDGNKYVQCRRLADRSFRCEAAGTLMQPSLEHVLTAERLSRLTALGWRLDPSFGSYVQVFPADAQSSFVADKIIQVLGQAYDADVAELEVESTWVRSEPCPPRNGPSQNLAGIVNDSPIMAATAVHACAYRPKADLGPNLPANSTTELIGFYGAKVTAEIQRLRVNARRQVFAIFDPGIGYVQCRPDFSPPTIYCEAQSAESWQALTVILTPERVRRLHELGYADPGRAPNYSKTYATDHFDDAAIAHELLTVLREVCGYSGQPTLKISTEE